MGDGLAASTRLGRVRAELSLASTRLGRVRARGRSTGARLPTGPVALAVAAAAIVWLATGVKPLEVLAFAAYQAVFVVGPGVLVLAALAGRGGSPVTRLAIGWPLGHALELAAFMVTAALGARWLLFLYPPLACGVALWVLLRRRSAPAAAPAAAALPTAPTWATAAIVAVGLALLGLGAFATGPLPRSVPSVALHPDNVFHVALAAEARHHWPMSDPNVSGESLRYHVFVHMEAAAVAQSTGIPIDVIVLRLQPVLIVLLIGLQLAWLAGRVARGSPWVPPGAVAILLLANELDVDSEREAPFTGLFFTDLPLSPTFAFGLPFFIAASGILARALSGPGRFGRGSWIVLGALLAGAMGAKASTLPVLMAALGLFVVSRLILDRTLDRRALAVLGLTLGVFVVVYLALFSGSGDGGGKIEPFAFLDYAVLAGAYSGAPASLVLDLTRTAALLAPWLGALLLIGHLRGPERTVALWLGAIAIGAFLPFVVFSQPALSQVYFLGYGLPAAAVLSAWGVARAWPADARDRVVPLAAVGAALAAALVLAAVLRDRVPKEEAPTVLGYLGAYGILVALLVLIAVVTARSARTVIAWGVVLLLAVTVLDKPLDVIPPWTEKETAGDPHYEPDRRAGPRGVDRELLAGLRWLRDNSAADDVIATDVHTTTATGEQARYFYPAAFAERQTFLGAWDYTPEGVEFDATGGPDAPFADRLALNARAFGGDPHALAVLRRRYDVRFLLVDLRHGPPRPVLDRRLRRVYANGALRVYRLAGRAGRAGAESAAAIAPVTSATSAVPIPTHNGRRSSRPLISSVTGRSPCGRPWSRPAGAVCSGT